MSGEPIAELSGRRILITGAARGIGAALAHRLHSRGARLSLVGLEDELLSQVAASCGDAHWHSCDVADRDQVEEAVEAAVGALGGLDVVVANAGVAAQLPLLGGDPDLMERTVAVNLMGVYHTIRAAGPHVAHPGGYTVLVSSLAAAFHLPMLGAYSASKAAVEALGNTLRIEMAPSGAKVGVAYFSFLQTGMVERGFETQAAARFAGRAGLARPAPLEVGIDALERGIARRSRRITAPRWVGPLLPLRMAAQPLVELYSRRRVADALAIARAERAELTTAQPGEKR